MKKTIAAVLTVILLFGGIVLFGGEKPSPELASTQVIQQA